MATTKQVSQALTTTDKLQVSLQELIRQSVGELKMAMPSHLSPERLVRIALTAIRLNPKLAQCTPESFLGSLFVLAQMGLEPIAGRAYLIPFNNSRKVVINGKEEWRKFLEVQAVIGYKGLADLFYRHESALSIDMQTVYEHDNFAYQYGTDSYLNHKPLMTGDRGKVLGYYAVAKMKGGGVVFRFMSEFDATEHGKKHSKTFDKKTNSFYPDSPWVKDGEAMKMKTVLIQLSKLLPLSVELQRAIQIDETSREYRTGIQSAIDLPDTTNWQDNDTDQNGSIIEIDKETPILKDSKLPITNLTEVQIKVAEIPDNFRMQAIKELKLEKPITELTNEECMQIITRADKIATVQDEKIT